MAHVDQDAAVSRAREMTPRRRKAALVISLASIAFAGLYLWPDVSDDLSSAWSWLAQLERFHVDKVAHLGMTFLLTLAYARAMSEMTAPGRASWVAAGSVLVYSGVLELAQTFVPGRSSSVSDFAANTAGVLLFVGLARYGAFRLSTR